MRRSHLIGLALVLFSPALAFAIDGDLDGLDDEFTIPVGPRTGVGDIAVIDTGEGYVQSYLNRLHDVGYSATPIPAESTLEVLVEYDLVILPTGHAAAVHYPTFDALTADYHAFVQVGGGLWIGQPNPIGQPSYQALITWVPYHLVISPGYTSYDCPPTIVDPHHCLTEGLTSEDLSFPTDQVVEMGNEWHILVEGPFAGSPSVMYAEYGSGRILIELGIPYSYICPPSDEAFRRYVDCIIAKPVATETTSWSALKVRFR